MQKSTAWDYRMLTYTAGLKIRNVHIQFMQGIKSVSITVATFFIFYAYSAENLTETKGKFKRKTLLYANVVI